MRRGLATRDGNTRRLPFVFFLVLATFTARPHFPGHFLAIIVGGEFPFACVGEVKILLVVCGICYLCRWWNFMEAHCKGGSTNVERQHDAVRPEILRDCISKEGVTQTLYGTKKKKKDRTSATGPPCAFRISISCFLLAFSFCVAYISGAHLQPLALQK